MFSLLDSLLVVPVCQCRTISLAFSFVLTHFWCNIVQLEVAIDMLDSDRDGTISYEEFSAWWSSDSKM